VIEKPINNRAWLLVLPVLIFVLFSALLPMMTVVNYSVQDSMGANNFFWNGDAWFRAVLDPTTDIGERFADALIRNLAFSFTALVIQVPLGIAIALCLPRRGCRYDLADLRPRRYRPVWCCDQRARHSL
jgi:glycerol transport system permease protein